MMWRPAAALCCLLLPAVAVAARPVDPKAAIRQLGAVAHEVPAIPRLHGNFFAHPLHARLNGTAASGRGFKRLAHSSSAAAANGSCTTNEYAAALSAMQTACTDLDSATDENRTTVMAQFCASGCRTAIDDTYALWGPCMGSAGAAYKELTWRCANTPNCFATPFFDAQATVTSACGLFDLTFADNPNLRTQVSQDDNAETTCQQTECRNAFKDLLADFGTCFSEQFNLVYTTRVDAMCAIFSERRCVNSLREMRTWFGNCDAAPTLGACIARGLDECRWDGATCDAIVSTADVAPLCSGCFDRVVGVTDAVVQAAFADARATQERIGQDPNRVDWREVRQAYGASLASQRQLRDMTCAAVGSTYCYPLVSDAFPSALFFNLGSSVTYAESLAAETAACSNRTVRACIQRVLGIVNLQQVHQTQAVYAACVAEAYARGGTAANTQGRAALCLPDLDTGLGVIAETAARVNFLCAANDAGAYCYSSARQAKENSPTCYVNVLSGFGCGGDGCDAWASASAQSLGCCMQSLAALYHNNSQVYDAGLVPAVPIADGSGALVATQVTPTPRVAVDIPWASHLFNGMATCSSVSGTIEADATRACVNGTGTTTSEVKTIKLRLRWSVVSADASLQSRLAASMRWDVANALFVNVANIAGGQVVEDAVDTLTVVTTAARRRQQSTTESSTAYTFRVTGASVADVLATVEVLDAIEADGRLAESLVATTAMVDATCEACTAGVSDSGTSVGVAPPPSAAFRPSATLAALLAVLCAVLLTL